MIYVNNNTTTTITKNWHFGLTDKMCEKEMNIPKNLQILHVTAMARELSNIYRVGSLKVITTYFETRRLWSVWSETCIIV